jgi:hypothetical protein
MGGATALSEERVRIARSSELKPRSVLEAAPSEAAGPVRVGGARGGLGAASGRPRAGISRRREEILAKRDRSK